MNDNEAKVAKFSLEKVAEYYEDENYGRAFAYLILCLELDPNNRTALEDILANITCLWTRKLEKRDEIRNARFCYNQALRYFPTNLKILNDYAAHYYRCKEIRMAFKHIEIAHAVHPQSLSIEKNLQSMYASKVPQWHYRMLNDKLRNEVYKLAIENTLKQIPPDTSFNIIDIGTGSGLLSLFARQRAKEFKLNNVHIVAVEECEIMSQVAHNIFNGNDLKVQLIQSLSIDIFNQHIYNALITEIFDCCLFGEGVLTSLIHAHAELLADNAVILPHSAKLFIFGVESDQLDSKFRFKPLAENVFKLRQSIRKVPEEPYDAFSINMFDYKQITSLQEVCSVNFNDVDQLKRLYFDKNAIDGVALKAIDSGVCHAFVICFELSLDAEGKHKITTNPLETENVCACWEQGVVFPAHSKSVVKDDILNLQVSANEDKFQIYFIDDKHINISAETSSSRPRENESKLTASDECTCALVSSEAITLLNFHRLYPVYDKMAANLCYSNTQSRILEISALPLFTLMLLHQHAERHKHIATVVIPEENSQATREFLRPQLNGTVHEHSRVNILHDINDAMKHIERYDHIIFEPVLENGLLNETFFRNLNSLKLRPGVSFSPAVVTLCFELVESKYFEQCTQAMDDNLFGLKISTEINKYSVHEMRSLSGNFQRKVLSSVVRTDIIYDDNAHENVFSVEATDAGVLRGFLYWFECRYGDDLISTKDSSYNMAAFVLACSDKVMTTPSRSVDVKVRQECGLLKISL